MLCNTREAGSGKRRPKRRVTLFACAKLLQLLVVQGTPRVVAYTATMVDRTVRCAVVCMSILWNKSSTFVGDRICNPLNPHSNPRQAKVIHLLLLNRLI